MITLHSSYSVVYDWSWGPVISGITTLSVAEADRLPSEYPQSFQNFYELARLGDYDHKSEDLFEIFHQDHSGQVQTVLLVYAWNKRRAVRMVEEIYKIENDDTE